MITTTKDPEAVEDFQLDWTDVLGSDTIVTSRWTITPVSQGLVVFTDSLTTTTTVVRLSGGRLGVTYLVKNVVKLASGQTKTRSLSITIQAD